MYKIIPPDIERVILSNSYSSDVYKNWKDKEYPDWLLMSDIEKDWKESLKKEPHLLPQNDADWLKAFSDSPEVKEYLEKRHAKLSRQKGSLKRKVKALLRKINNTCEGFDAWFWVNAVRTLIGPDLNRLAFEKAKIYFMLKPAKQSDKGVSKQEILNANLQSMPMLLGYQERPKMMIKCPINEERTASCSIRQKQDGTWRGKCFGCNESFDNISLTMKLYNLKFIDAVRRLN